MESDTLAEYARFKGHTGIATRVCFLSESSKIVSGSQVFDASVRLWDLIKPDKDEHTLKTDRLCYWARVKLQHALLCGSRYGRGSEI